MPKKTKPPMSHPDDLMVVSVCLSFQAKPNPDDDDPPSFDATELEQSLSAQDAGDYLEKLIVAIRERRLYGFFQQELAQSAVSTRQWIAKTTQDVLAEGPTEIAPVRLPNLKKIKWRAKD
jgi:hypothetical protein